MRGLNNTNRSLEDFTEHSVVAEKLCFDIPNIIVKLSESVFRISLNIDDESNAPNFFVLKFRLQPLKYTLTLISTAWSAAKNDVTQTHRNVA